MKKLSILLAFILILAIPAHCADTYQGSLDPLLSNMLKSIDKGDYDGFIRDLEGEMLEKTTKAEFNKMKDQLGEKLGPGKSLEYMGTIDKGEYIWALWKARFEKLDEDILIRMVCKKLPDGKFKISGLWFQ